MSLWFYRAMALAFLASGAFLLFAAKDTFSGAAIVEVWRAPGWMFLGVGLALGVFSLKRSWLGVLNQLSFYIPLAAVSPTESTCATLREPSSPCSLQSS